MPLNLNFVINTHGVEELMQNLEEVLVESVEFGVQETKANIHVITTKLKQSLRHDPPVRDVGGITVNFVAGGSYETGNDGLRLPVNYAFEEEVRHPIMRSTYPRAIKKYFAGKQPKRTHKPKAET